MMLQTVLALSLLITSFVVKPPSVQGHPRRFWKSHLSAKNNDAISSSSSSPPPRIDMDEPLAGKMDLFGALQKLDETMFDRIVDQQGAGKSIYHELDDSKASRYQSSPYLRRSAGDETNRTRTTTATSTTTTTTGFPRIPWGVGLVRAELASNESFFFEIPAGSDLDATRVCNAGASEGDVALFLYEHFDNDTYTLFDAAKENLYFERRLTTQVIGVTALSNSTNVTFVCRERLYQDLVVGQDMLVEFGGIRQRIVLRRDVKELVEGLTCTARYPEEPAFSQIAMYTLLRINTTDGTTTQQCGEYLRGTGASCRLISDPNLTGLLVFTPEYPTNVTVETLPRNFVVRCDPFAIRTAPALGIAQEVSWEPGEMLVLHKELGNSSNIQCNLDSVEAQQELMDLSMYDLRGHVNCQTSTETSSPCEIILNSGSTVIMEIVQSNSTENLEAPKALLTCYSGPVSTLTIGEAVPIVPDFGDRFLFNFNSTIPDANLECTLFTNNGPPDGSVRMLVETNDNQLVDNRGCFNDGIPDEKDGVLLDHLACNLGIIYEGTEMVVELVVVRDVVDLADIFLDCTNAAIEVRTIELGVPVVVGPTIDDATGDNYLFEFDVEDRLTNIICQNRAVDAREALMSISFGPIGIDYEKVIYGFGTDTAIVAAPWTPARTTFHAIVTEYSPGVRMEILCDTVSMGGLAINQPIQLHAPKDFIHASRRPQYLSGVPDGILFGSGKDFYLEGMAGRTINCTIENPRVYDVVFMREVTQDGIMTMACSSWALVGCMNQEIRNTTDFLIVSVMDYLENQTVADMTVLCTSTESEGGLEFPLEWSEDEQLLEGFPREHSQD